MSAIAPLQTETRKPPEVLLDALGAFEDMPTGMMQPTACSTQAKRSILRFARRYGRALARASVRKRAPFCRNGRGA